MVAEEARGGLLEGVVSRIIGSSTRVVAVSASIPNLSDIAKWLSIPETRVFDSSYKSVPVSSTVYGYRPSKNEYLFEQKLNYKLHEVIQSHSQGKSSLVFCQTQKGTVLAA